MSETISPRTRFCADGGVEGQDLLEGLAYSRAGGEGGSDTIAHTSAFQFQAEFEVEEFLEDEALVRGCGGGHQLQHRRAGFGEVYGLQCGQSRREVEAR